jgi:outer membrane protein OmpA-like peptidoglycan-associated protein
MKAYPKAMIKIGGYTDKTGDSLANIKLSNDRAVAVDAAIKAAGVDAARLAKPEGYGSQFAVVPAAASDEERKKDRRIAVGVREK